VWFGNDDDSPMNEVAGGGLPADTWRRFMEFAHTPEEGEPAPDVAGLDLPERVARTPREAELASYYGALARRFERIAAN
ncbi:MAG: penicillin-binding protein, partial [Maricaulaceae bacterium]